MLLYLYKDGITHEVLNAHEAARLKKLGYVEVKQPEPEPAQAEVPEVKPAEPKPAGKKAGK